MKQMKRSLILLSLIFLVFLAGCIGQTPAEERKGIATGVVIKSFAPDISEIFSGDSVIFSLTVENIGEEDATNVQAKLFGLGTDWSLDDTKQSLPDLSKSQPQYEMPGGITDWQWDTTSPSGLKVDNTYTAGVRVYYSYKTTALGTVKVYSYDYIKAKPEEAEKIMKTSGLATFTVTKAPITVELAGVARPLIYRGDNQSTSIMVQISNVGQGYPYDTEENDMKITIDEITVNNIACKGQTFPKTERLPRIGKKSVTCSFDLPKVIEYTTIPVEIKLSYNYFVDGSTSIKVLKAI